MCSFRNFGGKFSSPRSPSSPGINSHLRISNGCRRIPKRFQERRIERWCFEEKMERLIRIYVFQRSRKLKDRKRGWWFEEKEKMEKSLKINSHLRVSNAGEETWAISKKLEDWKKEWWFEKKEKMEKSLEINSHLRVSNGCRRILKRFQKRRIERWWFEEKMEKLIRIYVFQTERSRKKDRKRG